MRTASETLDLEGLLQFCERTPRGAGGGGLRWLLAMIKAESD
jgi:hypothetical protein